VLAALASLCLHLGPGWILVRFYGEHSSMWVREADLTEWEPASPAHQLLVEALRGWGRKHSKCVHWCLHLGEQASLGLDFGRCGACAGDASGLQSS
jgi:hypothetical protein